MEVFYTLLAFILLSLVFLKVKKEIRKIYKEREKRRFNYFFTVGASEIFNLYGINIFKEPYKTWVNGFSYLYIANAPICEIALRIKDIERKFILEKQDKLWKLNKELEKLDRLGETKVLTTGFCRMNSQKTNLVFKNINYKEIAPDFFKKQRDKIIKEYGC